MRGAEEIRRDCAGEVRRPLCQYFLKLLPLPILGWCGIPQIFRDWSGDRGSQRNVCKLPPLPISGECAIPNILRGCVGERLSKSPRATSQNYYDPKYWESAESPKCRAAARESDSTTRPEKLFKLLRLPNLGECVGG